jgi:hypothetical protein
MAKSECPFLARLGPSEMSATRSLGNGKRNFRHPTVFRSAAENPFDGYSLASLLLSSC